MGGPGSRGVSGGMTPNAGGGGPDTLVVTDPNRLVPVQIKFPAQPNNPNSHQRVHTVKVPAHALQQSGHSSDLLQGLLQQALHEALTLPETYAVRNFLACLKVTGNVLKLAFIFRLHSFRRKLTTLLEFHKAFYAAISSLQTVRSRIILIIENVFVKMKSVCLYSYMQEIKYVSFGENAMFQI